MIIYFLYIYYDIIIATMNLLLEYIDADAMIVSYVDFNFFISDFDFTRQISWRGFFIPEGDVRRQRRDAANLIPDGRATRLF